jgi:hypothetical protein
MFLHVLCIWDLTEFALQILTHSCIASVHNISATRGELDVEDKLGTIIEYFMQNNKVYK